MELRNPGAGGGATTVTTDGVTIQGNGSAGSPIALLDAETDGVTLTGAGISGSPLALLNAMTDGVTLQGAGISANKLALKAVQTAARLTGAGTVASPLDVAGWPLTWFTVDGISTNQFPNTNELWLTGFFLPAPLTFSHIAGYNNSGDASNLYDFGIYNASGTLLANIGARHIPGGGVGSFSTVQGAQTIPPGLYYAAWTGNSNTATWGYTTARLSPIQTGSYVATSGGNCPASITAPSPGAATGSLCFALF